MQIRTNKQADPEGKQDDVFYRKEDRNNWKWKITSEA